MEVFPMDPEAMFKIPTFFFTPGTELILRGKKKGGIGENVQNPGRILCTLTFGVESRQGVLTSDNLHVEP